MITMPGLPKLTGMLFCYRTRKEMMDVYERLKALNLQDVGIEKAYNQRDVQNKWTIAVICKDKKKLTEVDKILVNVDTGDADQYDGETRIKDFFGMTFLGIYEPGFIKVREGYCPIHATSPMACHIGCQFGHMTECHYPMTCEETRTAKVKCSHLVKYDMDEDAMYRDE